jgi:hypothetical protein
MCLIRVGHEFLWGQWSLASRRLSLFATFEHPCLSYMRIYAQNCQAFLSCQFENSNNRLPSIRICAKLKNNDGNF